MTAKRPRGLVLLRERPRSGRSGVTGAQSPYYRRKSDDCTDCSVLVKGFRCTTYLWMFSGVNLGTSSLGGISSPPSEGELLSSSRDFASGCFSTSGLGVKDFVSPSGSWISGEGGGKGGNGDLDIGGTTDGCGGGPSSFSVNKSMSK